MIKDALIKGLMKLWQTEIQFDHKKGATFRELFNHPYYLGLGDAEQMELGLSWCRNLYEIEKNSPSLDLYLGKTHLADFISEGSTILDIGCYIGGKTVRWIEKYKGAEIHGIDIDSKFIKVANRFAKEKCVNAHFKVNFAEDLDFEGHYFDAIVTENTFEHVVDLKKVMSECARVLKPNGYLIVSFPGFYGPFSHHLDLVTRTPCLHWFFKYHSLVKIYKDILDERGEASNWYKRSRDLKDSIDNGFPLNSLNGTSAFEFHKIAKENWKIVVDGFKQRTRNRNPAKSIILNTIKTFPINAFRELLPIAYVLQKPE
ncbi:MAG: methyltransferase [Bacteriovoracaceae bacterium]|nr:methyltransferase [Bacteriovoracaceae bacterium]